MNKQMAPQGSQIVITDSKDSNDNKVRTLFGNLQRTGGVCDFEVTATGPLGKIDEFAASLVYTNLQMVAIDDIKQYREERKQRAIEMRRKLWNTLLDKIRQYVDSATMDQLKDPNLLHQFSPTRKKPSEPPKRVFRPTQDFKIEIQPDGSLDPKCQYAFTYHVESMHSSIYVPQGITQVHAYRYNTNPPTTNSSWIDVTGGDPDVTLYCGGNPVDYSGNWAGVDESVYSDSGPGFWELYIYGYGPSNYYKLTPDWY